MADTLEAIFEEYGIKGGLSPAPTGGRFSQLDVDLANKEAREKSKNFFSLVKEQQLTTGTSIAAINYFTTPEPEELEFTEEVAKDLLEDITDPKIIKKVLEAGTEKGTAYARKIITEYGQQQEF